MRFRRKNIRLPPIHYRGRRWFFIAICCESRKAVFDESKNALRLIECLRTAAGNLQFGVHAFCVMPDHFHALVEGMAEDSSLLLFVRNFKQASSCEYAKRMGEPLWQKKFYDHILRAKDPPEAVSWYIWMNPVRKGICSRVGEYPYSGSFTEEWREKLEPKGIWIPAWKTRQIARP